jgi:hypothetical protein
MKMATLPKSEVSVSEAQGDGSHSFAITARREAGKDRTWTGSASTPSGAVKEAVEKMLSDPRTGEYLP